MIGGRNSLYVSFLYLLSINSRCKGTCPSGWSEIVGTALGCYQVSWEQKSYPEHDIFCRDNGGLLTSIHSETELNAITSLLWNGNGNFFIGLTDISKEGRWEYSDSTPFDFANWEYGEPNNVGDEDCVEMKNSGKWNGISCSRRFGAVCKLASTVTTAEREFLTEYVTDVHSDSTDTTAESEFLTEYVTDLNSDSTITTAESEFLTEYLTDVYSASTVMTAESEILTEYVTVNSETSVTSEANEFPMEHLSTEYNDADQNCPGEWFRYSDFCFFVDTTKRIFRDAKRACRTRGGELASIHSEEEQSFVYSILREDVQSYFIGLTFDTQTQTWNYTDGTTLDFTNWYPTMPDGGQFETCVEVYFYHDGKWNDVSCFSPFNGAICKASLGSSLVSGPLNEPDPNMIECGHGWLNYYDESFYCFINILLQWTEAAQMCADYGGHLVTIQDKYENDFLEKAMENFDVEFVWIGMSDLHEEGVWRWENSHNIPSYTNWDYLEPNNLHNEDCAVMYLYWNFWPRKGAWYDNACCHEFPSICKKQY
ncbi:Macrophage mannose receptor 1 [Holothuria leucospilota]|uniref:Macrophage mannose receptor 1 n=1 Tax=Holothuria leucospilota TaxID=206669 RepID=A0A9Q1C653_HOLLE|nr:Macrophage mannose receptor 1 [Holothuria leucospilota]